MADPSHPRDPDSAASSFPELLRKARTDRGLSQARLAELAGLERKTVSRWETGATQVTLPALTAVAKVLGWSSSDVAAILRAHGIDAVSEDPMSLVGISPLSAQVIAILDLKDPDALFLTDRERANLAETIRLVLLPYQELIARMRIARAEVARENAEKRAVRERRGREGAGS